MNLYTEHNNPFDKLFFLGDLHGQGMSIAPYLLRGRAVREKKKAIVHVGDFGIGYCSTLDDELEQLSILNRRLMEHNVTLFVVRGNHDDPYFFNTTEVIFTSRMKDEGIENIILLPDHTLLSIELKGREAPVKVYCNGGAVSIDRTSKIKGTSYWEDEIFKCPSPEQLENIPNDIDIICTHTRPKGVWPIVINNAVMERYLQDSQLSYDIRTEQSEMLKMFKAIKQKNKHNLIHIYGHFHKSMKERIDNIVHICLSKKELFEPRL